MGWTVLYIAFGFVALWLLAEVLLQYKARLRWRVLAFAGFLGVVAGVLLGSVLVIVAGAVAFAVGQTLVTLSFRRGFVAGWALGSKREAAVAEAAPGRRGRRRGGPDAGRRQEPALTVSELEYDAPDAAGPEGPDGPDGEFTDPVEASDAPVFGTTEDYPEQGYPQQQYDPPGYDPQAADGSGYPAGYPAAPAEDGAYQYSGYYDPGTQGADPYATGGYQEQAYPDPAYQDPSYQGYPYGTGEQQTYAAYSDPYIGTGGLSAQPDPAAYAAYDYGYGTGQDAYPGYPDPYTAQHQYASDTPPGGVWVPTQRDADQPYPAEQQPGPYPYQNTGEYEQYRY
ncbi:hypothetical protein [Streptomyces sp. NPDC089919]|uniref:hypothetical protein n=1 Tax=Streptomyces sp. NPDC089919 TaxID=3155188 RepID=UPI00341AAD71